MKPFPTVMSKLFKRATMELVLLLVCLLLAFKAPNFFTARNVLAILQAVAPLGIVAFGMTMVIITREIDLSVGSAVALTGCVLAFLVAQGFSSVLAVAAALLLGTFLGGLTGWCRVRLGMPTFITTLALYTAERGLALMITKGFPIALPMHFSTLGSTLVFSVALMVVFVFVYFLMRHTVFGASVYAVGGNDEAARLSGIPVGRVKMGVFAITGLLSGVSGVLLASRIMSGTPTVAQGFELEVIAAVVIGGTSFSGGVGSIWGTLVGVMFIGVIINGMTLMNVPVYTQYIVRGALIFAAVLANKLQEKHS